MECFDLPPPRTEARESALRIEQTAEAQPDNDDYQQGICEPFPLLATNKGY